MIQLSPRERGILDLIAEGYQDPAIAAALFISHSTVKTWKTSLYQKLSGPHDEHKDAHTGLTWGAS